ncbi:MAG TPA: selenocysteine-specific translation elongation factor [Candidatus Paceibacterota bacterium]|nr:selenocysteine-specific translation elongation factor [Verrucomicrobiota bacterium]HRY47150.1 selenocysteine-specific translation elongation factor [Candidatus Paceibacterota bacterium]HSA02555.1 selenocysteine-specific translation elongation factor [Candidatus Paceibacterota bacterium]
MTGFRKNIMLGTAGHVDHGKTALVKLLTGCDTDSLAEEKKRGMTIDLGFAPCRLADERIVGVVDVPGHVDFIRNMVAGAHGLDGVILVVAADDGIMPQTLEHLNILTLMGLRFGLVALTKIDLVEPAARDLVLEDIRKLLRGTFLEQAPVCPLSNLTGEGYEGFFDALNLLTSQCEPRSETGYFRAWVEDVHSIRGIGTVITGIPSNGKVRLGDHLELIPGGQSGRVRQLQVYGEDAPEGRAGECVAINLAEVNHEWVRRGRIICEPGSVAPVTLFEAEFQLLDSARKDLKDFAEVHFHVGTAAVSARVAMLEGHRMTPGQSQMVQFRLPQPLGVVPGDRFVVRAQAADSSQSSLATIGGGRILDASNVRLRRHRAWTLDALRRRRDAIDHPTRWCEVVLQQAERPVGTRELSQRTRLRPEEVQEFLDQLRNLDKARVTAEGNWVHQEVIDRTVTDVLVRMEAFHNDNPHRLGAPPEELLPNPDLDRALFHLALEQLLAKSVLARHGALLAKKDWKPKVQAGAPGLGDQIATRLRAAGLAVPSLEELAIELHVPSSQLQAACRLLLDRGILVQLDDRILMHQETIALARLTVLRLFRKAPSFTTMDFRDALGVSRKFAVPLLDYFDRIRVTVRNGNVRTPGAVAKTALGSESSSRIS